MAHAHSFEGQHENEEVLMVFRRHPIAMRKGFYMLLIPFLIASLPVYIWPGDIRTLYIAFGGLGLGLLLFFYYWIAWYFTMFILTSERLRQVTQTGLFGKSVIDLNISQIQNVSYNVPGLNASLFGFGTIVIQTFVGDLILDRIHHPAKTYNRLNDAVHSINKGTYEKA